MTTGLVNFLQANQAAKPKTLSFEQIKQVHMDKVKPSSRGGEGE